MIKRKLKDWVIPTLGIIVVLGSLFCYYLISNIINDNLVPEDSYVTDALIEKDNNNRTNNNINDNSINVNKEVEVKAINPYKGENINISKYYYSKEADETRQQQSLIKYQNIYMPNTGVLYGSDNEFEIVTVLDGKVVSIKEDDILGNIIEIEHENNIVTIYQSVKDVKVKIGDNVTQGTVIAISGPNKLEQEKENCLHFEVYKEGSLTNPEDFLNITASN